MPRRNIDLLDNAPPAAFPDPPPPPPPRSAAVAASQRKDRLKRNLAKKNTQAELQRTSGQQGSSNRKRLKLEEDEAARFRRSRR